MPDTPEAPHNSQPSEIPAWCLLGVLLLVTLVVRLPGVNRPLVGGFATKNVVYAMIARNLAEGRASWLYPTLDCLEQGERGLHMLELPVSAYATAIAWKTFGGSLDQWGRLTSILFGLAAVALLFGLVRDRHGPTAALGAATVLALSPVAIVYGQSFMLESSLVFFTVATFAAVDRWIEKRKVRWLVAGGVCLALLLLTKVYMAVVLLPLGVEIVRGVGRPFSEESRKTLVMGAVVLTLATIPAVLWYWHAMATAVGPLADHVYYSVRSSAAVHRPPHPLLGSPDFYTQLLDDLTGIVLTPIGFGLLLIGMLDRSWRRYLPWLAASLLLIVLLPRKFHEMNYYYLAILPPLCVLAGLGWQVASRSLPLGRRAVACLLLLGLALSLRYAVGPAFMTPEEDRAVVRAADAVRDLTDAEEPVVTMHGSTIDLLYYCDRPGWAIAPTTPDLDQMLDACRNDGAKYLVIAGPEADLPPEAVSQLSPVQSGAGYAVYRLDASR